MWRYRPDEIAILKGSGIPSGFAEGPTIYYDTTTGVAHFNIGGGTVWNPPGALNFETLTAARVLVAGDNNKTFWLSLAGGFDITLPALATTGFKATFIVKTVPTTAYTITGATADKIMGHVLSSSGAAEDVALVADPGDVINFVANTAVQGDIVEVWMDGAFYYASARCAVTGGITVTG